MTDERLRKLERAYEESAGTDEGLALAAERVRQGKCAMCGEPRPKNHRRFCAGCWLEIVTHR